VQGKKQTKRNNKGRKEGINKHSFLKDKLATVIFFLFVVSLVIFSVPRLCSVNCRRMNLKMVYWSFGGKKVISEY
jgi:hypothetical protein